MVMWPKLAYGPFTLSVNDNAAMMLVILVSFKTMESLQNRVTTHFGVTPLFSMRAVLLASSLGLMLTLGVNGPLRLGST